MREFIATNQQVETTGTINLGVTNLSDYGHSSNTHGLGEIVVLGTASGKPAPLNKSGADAVAKAVNGIKFGVKTPSTIKWSGTILNNPSTIVTKCTHRDAVAGVKTYTIANSGALEANMYVGILVENTNYPYFMGTKRQQLFEFKLTSAYLTSGVINSTGWTALAAAFNAKFGSNGKNWCTLSGTGAVITLTATVAGTDVKISGTNDTGIITYTYNVGNTQPANAYNTGALLAETEKEIAVREGYNPFWTIDAKLWTSESMIALTAKYTTYVIEYSVPETGAVVIPALRRRECIIAVPSYSTGVTENPDVTALDNIFTALATNNVVTSDAITGTAGTVAASGVAIAGLDDATTTVVSNGGLIFRTV